MLWFFVQRLLGRGRRLYPTTGVRYRGPATGVRVRLSNTGVDE